MTRDSISVQLPIREATASIEVATFAKQSVTVANGIVVANAFAEKNNSLAIIIEPSTAAAVTFKAGNKYPNAMLGDLTVTPTGSKPNVYHILDAARFENADGSINIDFATGFVGTIYAIGKRAGVLPVANQ